MQAKHTYLILIVIFFSLYIASAQSTQERLRQQLTEYKQKNTSLSDYEKAEHLSEIASEYMSVNLDSCRFFADSALHYARVSNKNGIVVSVLTTKATSEIWSGDYASAQKSLSEANIIAQNPEYKEALVDIYAMYSYMYQLNELWDEAWIYNKKLDEYIRNPKNKFPFHGGDVFDNYAVIYDGLGEYKKANFYFEKAIDAFKKDSFYDILANCKLEYATSQLAQNKFEKAFQNITEAHEYFFKQDEPVQISDVNEKFAQYYIATKDYDSAQFYLKKSINYYVENGLMADEYRCKLFMAKIYMNLNNYKDAKINAFQVNNFFKQRPEKHLRIGALEILYKADKALGIKENAFQYLEEYIAVNAELDQDKSEMRTRELIAASDLNELQTQNDTQRQRLTLLIISAVCILIFTGLLFILYRQKNKVLDHVKLLQETGQQKNAELEKINGVKDKLISMIAHDIRSPLASVQNTLSLTQDETLSPHEFQSLGKVLEGEIHHLRGMLDNLLLWARQQVTDININKTTFNLYELITETLGLYEKNIAHKKIKILNNINPETSLFSDRDIIQTVFRNMLSNALKFTNPDKKIEIFLQEENDQFLLIIKDEGMGISPENLTKIIKKEYLSTRGTSNEKGTGLGLMFSKELLEKLGENLIIESTPNKGTSVFITISK